MEGISVTLHEWGIYWLNGWHILFGLVFTRLWFLLALVGSVVLGWLIVREETRTRARPTAGYEQELDWQPPMSTAYRPDKLKRR